MHSDAGAAVTAGVDISALDRAFASIAKDASACGVDARMLALGVTAQEDGHEAAVASVS